MVITIVFIVLDNVKKFPLTQTVFYEHIKKKSALKSSIEHQGTY